MASFIETQVAEIESPILQDVPTMLRRELTLIVAATSKNMGIGKDGGLPWNGLKKEMAYFANVTKKSEPGMENVVIMGRKTWESIPEKFRPLKDRTNVVISRSYPDSLTCHEDGKSKAKMEINSLPTAVSSLATATFRKTFAIGGAEIYKSALQLSATKRILLTRILDNFECDTFFPLHLGENGKAEGWERMSISALQAWVGITVPGGVQEENGTKYVFEMWEKAE